MSIFLYRMRIQWHKWLVYLIRRVQRFVLSFRFFFSNMSSSITNAKTFLLRIQSIAWKRGRKPNVYRSFFLVISSNREVYIVEGVDYTWLPGAYYRVMEPCRHWHTVWKQHKTTPNIRKKKQNENFFSLIHLQRRQRWEPLVTYSLTHSFIHICLTFACYIIHLISLMRVVQWLWA